MTRPTDLKRGRFFVAHSVLVHGVLLTGILLLLLVFIPNLKKTYDSYNTTLPSPTYLLMKIGIACRGVLAIPVILGAILLLAADAVWAWRLAANARPISSFAWGVGVTCALIFVTFSMIYALFMPFMSGSKSVGSSAG